MNINLLLVLVLVLGLAYLAAASPDSYEESSKAPVVKKNEEDDDDEKQASYADLTTVVQGYVYCQDCHGKWNRSLAGVLVGVECKKDDGSVIAYGEDYSDETGFFGIKFKYQYENVYGPESCKATLLTSPDSTCNTATNVGNGKQGAALHFHKIFFAEAFFTTGPFAFMPYCPKKCSMAPPAY